jgi:ribosome-associated protein YbcJ (S4-like RNA binding protein)
MENKSKLPELLINAKVEDVKKCKICKSDAICRKRRSDERICIDNKQIKIKRK